jgi:regulatory protein
MPTPPNKAYLYLVKIISGRDYSEHKLREKLSTKKYSANEIESAICEIKNRGFLREEIFAEARVKGFMERGYSPDYIRQRLAQEHLTVTDEEIEAVFTEHGLTTEDQIDRLVRKKIQGKTDFDYAGESKILRYLLSKGHDFGDSKKVLKSIIGEVASQSEY